MAGGDAEERVDRIEASFDRLEASLDRILRRAQRLQWLVGVNMVLLLIIWGILLFWGVGK